MEILRSPRELAEMRKAGLLVWQAHQRVVAMLRPGVTTAELDAEVDRFFAEHHAQPLFKGFPGAVPFPASTCISINEEVVHGIPGKRQLAEGDIVSVDTGCKLNGWCGDAAATYAVGRVAPEVRQLMDVAKNALSLAIALLDRCSRWSQVAAEMEAYVKKHRLSVVEAFVGHGIGREMHEDPQVPNFVGAQMRRGHGDFRLAPGLVIAIEPMVNIGTKRVRTKADHWTQVTADGRPSAHFEHTVALTENGPWVLTAGPNGETW
ncbi:MAG: type I methionyl aminopeptidase [Planctomycetaceae bacterium]|nr:type I methionyl aminopeptidase [Planctomycetaceae bacterium]